MTLWILASLPAWLVCGVFSALGLAGVLLLPTTAALAGAAAAKMGGF